MNPFLISKDFNKENIFKQILNEDFYVAILKIEEDSKIMIESLKIINQILGVEFELAIVGGSIRDLLLGKSKEIKDIDYLISIKNEQFDKFIPKHNYYQQLSNDIQMLEIFNSFTESIKDKFNLLNIEKFEYDNELGSKQIEQFIFHIIKNVINKKLNVTKELPPIKINKETEEEHSFRKIFAEDYMNMLLRGVLKINSDKLNYPTDLLITNIKIKDYIETFDFNICKTYLPLYSTNENIKYDKLEENIIITENFLEDAINKTITLNPMGFINLDKLISSVENHLVRIENKYKDHTFSLSKEVLKDQNKEINNLFYEDFNDSIQNDTKNYLLSLIKYKLISNDINSIKVKSKINKI